MRTSGVSRVWDAGQREDEWGDDNECSSSGEVGGMGRGDAGRRENGWGDADESSSSGEVDCMGRGDVVRREDG